MRRVRYALAALVFAGAVVTATGWTEACVAFERWSVQWVALGCWYGEPDPPPCSNCG